MTSKKKILVLSSYGGYGHIASAKTLQKLLSDDYDIDVIYPIKELRLCGLKHSEAFYNYFLARNFNRFTNWYVRYLGTPVMKMKAKKLKRLLEQHIKEKQTDLVISLIPLVNYPASMATYQMGIPFLMVTTDNDITNWVCDLNKRKHHQFKVTIGADLPTTKGVLLSEQVSEKEIEHLGLPLRPEFFQQPSKEEMRAKYGIENSQNVVLVMMGGAGTSSGLKYVKILAQSQDKIHLIVCSGRNQKLAKNLQALSLSAGNTMEVVPFTENVHELFAIADMIITKPGPGTINEAIACQLPILIDRINTPIFWEEANIDLVLKYKIGDCVRQVSDVPMMVHRFLYDEQFRESISQGYKSIPKNQFAERIRPLIDEMVGEMAPVEEISGSNV
ncbi:MAG: glycosyltransferase [Simkaniaceae bacterium]|nr:glycosyltransferase [Candidatus Sacchlamyda saccharinae]